MPASVPASPARSAAVVLGLLRLGARTGYDVKRVAGFSIRHFWALSYAQIYPLLKQLAHDGLVEATNASGGRGRLEYLPTAQGHDALVAWLTAEDDLAFELRDEGLLKLFFADALDAEQQLELVRSLRLRAERLRDHLREHAIPPGEALLDATGNRYPLLAAEIGLAVHTLLAERAAQLEDELSKTTTRSR